MECQVDNVKCKPAQKAELNKDSDLLNRLISIDLRPVSGFKSDCYNEVGQISATAFEDSIKKQEREMPLNSLQTSHTAGTS